MKIKVAVFGHYDSRGGTAAIRLPDNPTMTDVGVAMLKYDRDLFGVEELYDDIETTAYGMPARECDRMVHKLMHQDRMPSEEDFLFVADLHVPDVMRGLEGDLEEIGEVLWDPTTAPENVPLRAWYKEVERLNEGKPGHERYKTYQDMDGVRPADFTVDQLVEMTLANPVQLEFTSTKLDGDIDTDIDEPRVEATAKAIKNAKCRRWDDDAYGFCILGG